MNKEHIGSPCKKHEDWKLVKKEPFFSVLLLPLLFFATFLWANFAAMPMMNDCEKSARHLWLLWLMNTPLDKIVFEEKFLCSSRLTSYFLTTFSSQ